ncbi:hypothetical protein Q9295_16350 [Xinfangfangia sp. CPCC 101601]|uniref:EF-hand domain-containing protein n=1 Tax=Pseudogemmobacter lacusdianii TaxID=3069608 RepID=A0ABU0W1Q0_9RHOB|nr:hypothetical protein [Xinfangfangia sp. CPCC 101601]MDQ2067946.1 hypothetical protein [Xinfangfangia sp. CPCC 101601]
MRLAYTIALTAGLASASPSFAQSENHPFDTDLDGNVSLQEWMEAGELRHADFGERLAKAQPEVIEANFRKVDANGDGKLDAEEQAAAKAARDAAAKAAQ